MVMVFLILDEGVSPSNCTIPTPVMVRYHLAISTNIVKIKCYIYCSHLYCPKEDHPGKLSLTGNNSSNKNCSDDGSCGGGDCGSDIKSNSNSNHGGGGDSGGDGGNGGSDDGSKAAMTAATMAAVAATA